MVTSGRFPSPDETDPFQLSIGAKPGLEPMVKAAQDYAKRLSEALKKKGGDKDAVEAAFAAIDATNLSVQTQPGAEGAGTDRVRPKDFATFARYLSEPLDSKDLGKGPKIWPDAGIVGQVMAKLEGVTLAVYTEGTGEATPSQTYNDGQATQVKIIQVGGNHFKVLVSNEEFKKYMDATVAPAATGPATTATGASATGAATPKKKKTMKERMADAKASMAAAGKAVTGGVSATKDAMRKARAAARSGSANEIKIFNEQVRILNEDSFVPDKFYDRVSFRLKYVPRTDVEAGLLDDYQSVFLKFFSLGSTFRVDHPVPPCNGKERDILLKGLERRMQTLFHEIRTNEVRLRMTEHDDAKHRAHLELFEHLRVLHDRLYRNEGGECMDLEENGMPKGSLTQVDAEQQERFQNLVRQLAFLFLLMDYKDPAYIKRAGKDPNKILNDLEKNGLTSGEMDDFLNKVNKDLPGGIPQNIGELLDQNNIQPNLLGKMTESQLQAVWVVIKQKVEEWQGPPEAKAKIVTMVEEVEKYNAQEKILRAFSLVIELLNDMKRILDEKETEIAGLRAELVVKQELIIKLEGEKAACSQQLVEAGQKFTEEQAKVAEAAGKAAESDSNLGAAQAEINELKRKLAEIEDRIGAELAQKTALTARITALEAELEGLRTQNAELSGQVATMREQLEEAERQRQWYQNRVEDLTAELNAKDEQITQKNAEIDEARAAQKGAEDKIGPLEANVAQLTAEKGTLEEQLQKCNAEKAALEEELRIVRGQVAEKEAEIAGKNKELEELQRQYSVLDRSFDKYHEQAWKSHEKWVTKAEEYKKEQARLNQQIQSLGEQITSLEGDKAALTTRIAELEQQLKELTERGNGSAESIRTLKGQLAAANAEKKAAQTRNGELEEQIRKLTEEREEAREWARKLDGELEELRGQYAAETAGLNKTIADLTGENQELRVQLENEKAKIQELNAALAACEAEKGEAERLRKECADAYEALKGEMAGLHARIAELERELAELRATQKQQGNEVAAATAAKQQELEAAQAALAAKSGEFEDLRGKLAACETKNGELLKRIKELEAQVAGGVAALTAKQEELNRVVAEKDGVIAGLKEQIEKLTKELQELRETHQIWKDGYKEWQTNEEEWFGIQKKYNEQIIKLREDIQKLEDALAAAAKAKATAEAGAKAAAAACEAATSGARAEGEAEGKTQGSQTMYTRILEIIRQILEGGDIPGDLPTGSGGENQLLPLLNAIKGLRDKPAGDKVTLGERGEFKSRIARLLCFFVFFANFFIQLFFLYDDDLVDQRLAAYKEYNDLANKIYTDIEPLVRGDKPRSVPSEVWLSLVDTLFYALFAAETFMLTHKEPDGDDAKNGLILMQPSEKDKNYGTKISIYKTILGNVSSSTSKQNLQNIMSSVIDGYKATIPKVYYVGQTVEWQVQAGGTVTYPLSFFYVDDPAVPISAEDVKTFKFLKMDEGALADSPPEYTANLGAQFQNYINDLAKDVSFDHLFALFIIATRGYVLSLGGEIEKCPFPKMVAQDPKTLSRADLIHPGRRRLGYTSTQDILAGPPAAIKVREPEPYNYYNRYPSQPASPPSTPTAGVSSWKVSSAKQQVHMEDKTWNSGTQTIGPRRWPSNTKSTILRNRAIAQKLGDKVKYDQTFEREADLVAHRPYAMR